MWQPIETAPKDGSSILLATPKGRIADGFWSPVYGVWSWPYVMVEPTHWMPLPGRPSAQAQPSPSVQDRWKEGVEAAARLIDQKAELYAIRFGHDDMGVLSFGTGSHAEIKMGHYTSMIELADEVRAMLAAAPKPEGE